MVKNTSPKVKVAQLCLTLCDTVDYTRQVPLSMELSRQEHWSQLPFPSSGDLLDPGTKPIAGQILHQGGPKTEASNSHQTQSLGFQSAVWQHLHIHIITQFLSGAS